MHTKLIPETVGINYSNQNFISNYLHLLLIICIIYYHHPLFIISAFICMINILRKMK